RAIETPEAIDRRGCLRARARAQGDASSLSERPTIRDVARSAGVSIATVSRVLNDKSDVSVQTRERVRAAATSLGYTADPTAQALVSQKTRLVAVIVGDN